MNLHALLLAREAPATGHRRADRRRQVRHHVPLAGAAARPACISSASPISMSRARAASSQPRAGPTQHFAATSLDDALKRGTHATSPTMRDALIAAPDIDVIVEATGDPKAGIRIALAAIAHGKHIVMVNVEADALAGPLLARKARAAGVVYSLAWGDQPALICEHVDWARACGFKVISAGKGTRYDPHYHRSNARHGVGHPRQVSEDQRSQLDQSEDVQLLHRRHQVRHRDDGGVQRHRPRAAERRPRLSARDAASNSPISASRAADGGTLEKTGVTEVVSSVDRDEARRAASSRDGHLRGVRGRERLRAPLLPRISPAAGQERALRRAVSADPHDRARTRHLGRLGGAARRADRHADRLPLRRGRDRQARRCKAGEMLDGEGGFCVWGKQMPARSVRSTRAVCRSGSRTTSSSSAISPRARR